MSSSEEYSRTINNLITFGFTNQEICRSLGDISLYKLSKLVKGDNSLIVREDLATRLGFLKNITERLALYIYESGNTLNYANCLKIKQMLLLGSIFDLMRAEETISFYLHMLRKDKDDIL